MGVKVVAESRLVYGHGQTSEVSPLELRGLLFPPRNASRNALETLLVVYYAQDFKKESGDLGERLDSVDTLRSFPLASIA